MSAITQYRGDLMSSIMGAVDACYQTPLLMPCQWESGESIYAACDGQICVQPATVTLLTDEREYCARHFKVVSR